MCLPIGSCPANCCRAVVSLIATTGGAFKRSCASSKKRPRASGIWRVRTYSPSTVRRLITGYSAVEAYW